RGAGAAGARALARVLLARGAPHPDPRTAVAGGHGHPARAAGGRAERAARRVRSGGGASPARAAGAGVARQLARTLAAAPQARPGRAAPFACVARRGRDGADPVRRAAPDAGPPAAMWGIAVRGPRVVSASVRMQR